MDCGLGVIFALYIDELLRRKLDDLIAIRIGELVTLTESGVFGN
jgi:hypothetical protein